MKNPKTLDSSPEKSLCVGIFQWRKPFVDIFSSVELDLSCTWYEQGYYILRCYHYNDIKSNIFF